MVDAPPAPKDSARQRALAASTSGETHRAGDYPPRGSAHRVSWWSQHTPIGQTVAMWWTPLGERVLRGAEWQLFRDGLGMVCDLVEEAKSSDDPEIGSVGVEAFDQLQPNQKLALLARVGKALKDEREPMPELTAHTKATVAAVYAHILAMIVMEIEFPPASQKVDGWDDPEDNLGDAFAWRRLALAAYLEANEEVEA